METSEDTLIMWLIVTYEIPISWIASSRTANQEIRRLV